MVYNKLYLSVSIRVILLGVTLFAMAFTWQKWDDPLILVNLLALVILQAVLFIRNMNQVNIRLATFFESLHFDDTGLFSARGYRDRSFRRLYQAMQDVLMNIQQKNSENYRQKQFYQSVNEHSGTALLVCDDKGKILLKNRAFLDLFNIPDVIKLEDIENRVSGFTRSISALQAGEQKLVCFMLERSGILEESAELELTVKKTLLRMEKVDLSILSFQNIRLELENRESESWEKIIRVLTHEIMNTSGPLVSSAQTLIELVAGPERDKIIRAGDVSQELLNDLLEGLKIIEDRSMGLDKFVKDFRKVTLLPDPTFESIVLSDLVRNLSVLYDKKLKDHEITLLEDIPDDLLVFADKGMLEQLLINLITNAIDAVVQSDAKRITISAVKKDRKISIQISDTGSGLSQEELEKVFIPFYSRKKQGSGIGLSLARQIMRKHGGTIRMKSTKGEGSRIILEGLPEA